MRCATAPSAPLADLLAHVALCCCADRRPNPVLHTGNLSQANTPEAKKRFRPAAHIGWDTETPGRLGP